MTTNHGDRDHFVQSVEIAAPPRAASRSENSVQKLAVPISEAQLMTGLSRSTIYVLASEGRLRFLKAGRRTLVTTESIRGFLESLPEAQITPSRKAAA